MPAIIVALLIAASPLPGAGDRTGRVLFGGLPVPGASVAASRGDRTIVTSTDADGVYTLADVEDGLWTIRVDMLGFRSVVQDVTIAPDASLPALNLQLRPFDEIAREAPAAPRPAEAAPAPAPSPDRVPQPVDGPAADSPFGAAPGLLVNGSVNNGAASPFAQIAAFGNNRRGLRSLYTGGVAAILDNSAWDARPFSFTARDAAKPDYNDVQLMSQFGGPLKIPGLRSTPNFFIGYQHTSDHNATTQPALVPTEAERLGDFSQSRDALGGPVRIVDPSTGLPFPGNAIPHDRISPQAAALLGYYPLPTLSGRYNYQAPLLTATRQDNIQTRVTQSPFNRNQVFGTFTYQRTTTEAANLFGFADSTRVSGIDAAVNWSRRLSPFLYVRARYQITRLTTEVTPYFASRLNVSGDAGIAGNNQDPVNWGPPTIAFANGVESLNDADYGFTRNLTHAWNGETLVTHGRHFLTMGGDLKRVLVDVRAQQNARGAFSFTGSATGSDLADFLLGIPRTSAIAFGNADKDLRANAYDLYLDDDWRVTPGLSVKAGVRWEYEAPFTEGLGRLVNLDIASGFTAVAPVVASHPVGSLSGRRYPDSLIRPDRLGIQPRVGVAWRPIAGSSLVIRGGYGIYRNTNVYQSIATLLAQQPPLSKAFSVQNSAATPLTLANGFTVPPGFAANTFAVDPDFRVGTSENWQASVQRDLPTSLTVLATYLGTRGHRLMQEILPNTYPAGAVNPCPTCPAGFVYLTSSGRSLRHAAQLELRRRLRNGLTATTKYTRSTANDDSGAFTGVSLSGSAIAQDWLNPAADWAPSNFDQRHLLTLQLEYTSGVGVRGGTLVDGIKGSLLKGWTVTSQVTTGSGLPLTPVYLTPVAGTGVTGSLRPDLVNAVAAPDGSYANPSAFAAPASGRWGTAGRNAIAGPAQFSLNAGVTRTFPWRDRFSLDWRIDATNILNRVTYSGANVLFGSPQFGLPNRANTMRKLQTALRLRF